MKNVHNSPSNADEEVIALVTRMMMMIAEQEKMFVITRGDRMTGYELRM